MSSILRKAMWSAAIIAAMFMALAAVGTVQATAAGDSDLTVNQCPFSVFIEGDSEVQTVVLFDPNGAPEQNFDPPEVNPDFLVRLAAGESATFFAEGWYEIDPLAGDGHEGNLVKEVSADECPNPTTITVVKDTDPEENDEDVTFRFDIDPGVTGDFNLADDGSRTFEVSPGDYKITEVDAEDGWELDGINCVGISGSKIDYDVDSGSVTVELSEGDDVTCTFNNIPTLPVSTPTPVPPVVDACDNIAGAQPTVPAGMVLRISGDLVLCEVPVATVVPPSISPPNTGDGGLLSSSNDDNVATRLAAGITAIFLGFGGIVLARRFG